MEITCRVYSFERSYGFWRGLVDEAVASHLACGLWQGGFARVRRRRCPEEFLVAFSCKRRGENNELMVAAVEEKGCRPGMVSVVRTFGEGAKFHPLVHALFPRGGWAASGEWIPLPYVDEGAAEKLFRHKVRPRDGREFEFARPLHDATPR